MSLQSISFRIHAGIGDYRRDKAIPLPEGVVGCRNIRYNAHGNAGLLDVYYPKGTEAALPTIVSIHGGGYVYGSKEIYRRYCMDLARRGFSVVNFNYRLAPKDKFPAPLRDTNAVMRWLHANAKRYYLDPERILLIGDSAGAQLASQYAAIATNPDYAAAFGFRLPPVHIRALGLNCGLYDMAARAAQPRKGLNLDYLGRDLPADDPRFRVLDAITDKYPPAFIMTACHDFLRQEAQPMFELLRERGVEAELHCYGAEDREQIAHVFHVNISLPEATECNNAECAFFRKYV